jgi:hypothetical protein
MIDVILSKRKLHDAIRRAAAHRTAWDAGEKIWLCDLADELKAPLQDLAGLLIDARILGWIRLSRCDLPQLAPDGLVEASEISCMNGSYHFVRIPG